MSSDRRQLLGRALAAAALAACRGPAARARSPVAALPPGASASLPPLPYRGRPHHVVAIFLRGGMDAVLTVDPKDPRTVGPGIDCGYTADERVRGSRRLFGPLIGDLVRHDDDLCLVHGVRCDTVSHNEGELISLMGKIAFRSIVGMVAPTLGAQLPGGAPMPWLVIRCSLPEPAPLVEGVPAGEFLDLVNDRMAEPASLTPDSFLRTAAALRRLAPPWQALADAEVARAADRELAEGARAEASRELAMVELMRRTSLVPAFSASAIGPGLGIALDALRGNVARCVHVVAPYLWFDSHTDNLALQRKRLVPAFADIAAFLDHLKTTRNQFGPLSEQTTVMIFSELGRFPRFNPSRGKDHFPENSWMLFGRGIRKGITIGATSPRYQGLAIDYGTGQPDPAGRTITVDSMFASIFHIAGVDPGLHGYQPDQVLTCLKG